MAHQTQAQAALVRELARIRRVRKRPIHAGYVAIVAKARELGLPHRYATDITIHDRLLIAQRQPRQFAWRADTRAAPAQHAGAKRASPGLPARHTTDVWICTAVLVGRARPHPRREHRPVDDAHDRSMRRIATQSGGTAVKKQHTPQRAGTLAPTNPPDPTSTPITPAEALSQTCACCGAILPLPLSRLDAIAGQEQLRRAVTIALTGNHPITFLGMGASLADALAFGRIARSYGLTAYVTTPCICGNAGDPYVDCHCSPEAIVDWRRRPAFQAALSADIVVEAAHTSAEQRLAHRHGRRGTPDEDLMGQAREAQGRPRPSEELDGVSQRLLAAAIRQLQLNTEQVARLLAVAQSIAQLADQPQVLPVHLAEALQYHSRIAAIVELLEPASPDEQTTEG
jgi:hypothetical protein